MDYASTNGPGQQAYRGFSRKTKLFLSVFFVGAARKSQMAFAAL